MMNKKKLSVSLDRRMQRYTSMKSLLYIIIGVAALLLPTSCDIESSGNGKLDGNWRIVSIDTLSNSRQSDYSSRLTFWAVQHDLLYLYDTDGAAQRCLMRFDHTDDTLRVFNPYLYDRDNGDVELDNAELLMPYGINKIDEKFIVEALSSSKMILKSDMLRVKFIKR